MLFCVPISSVSDDVSLRYGDLTICECNIADIGHLDFFFNLEFMSPDLYCYAILLPCAKLLSNCLSKPSV